MRTVSRAAGTLPGRPRGATTLPRASRRRPHTASARGSTVATAQGKTTSTEARADDSALAAADDGRAAGGTSDVAAPAGPSAPPAGSVDLAGSLRGLLQSVDTEVRAVGGLSERIDRLVTQLNEAREEQATRLQVLDDLRASVQDETLGAFLEKAIRPRRTRVVEVFPDRLDHI